MREIKFRAWDKTNKRWCSQSISLISHPDCAFIVKEDDIEIMQFTGLLDKNGREIYMGIDYLKRAVALIEDIELITDFPGIWHTSDCIKAMIRAWREGK